MAQSVKGQLDRDRRIADLVNMMEDVYTFVDDVKSFPSRLSSLEETIKKILFQTIECSLFIQEYSGRGFGGTCFALDTTLILIRMRQVVCLINSWQKYK